MGRRPFSLSNRRMGGGGGLEQSQRRQQNDIFATYSCSHVFGTICTVCVYRLAQAAPMCKQLQNKPPPLPHPRTQTHTNIQEI
jgi:hypothetical protein